VNGGERIIRFVDQRLIDGQFRQALAVIRQRERARMAPIVDHAHLGSQYYLEYQVGAGCLTLEERLGALPHWSDRLAIVQQVCAVLPEWLECPIRPLGLTLRDVIMRPTGDGWYPWLLPCPPVRYRSPAGLLDVDRDILATLAPEVVRGTQIDHVGQDAYALGTLAAQAAGCRPAGPTGDDAVTDQARNALLPTGIGQSAVPDHLGSAAPVRHFFGAVRRYRDADPDARPPDATDLAMALPAMTDVVALAQARLPAEPAQALEVLSGLRPEDGEPYRRGTVLAADLRLRLGDPAQARQMLDGVLERFPGHLPALRLRADALWQLVGGDADAEPDDLDCLQLVADLDALKGDREAGAGPFLRAAALHRRRGRLADAAEELYRAAEADPGDLDVLRLYGEVLRDLGGSARDTLRAVVELARKRIDQRVRVGLITEEGGTRWHAKFTRLLG
jgi:hypothetical protein